MTKSKLPNKSILQKLSKQYENKQYKEAEALAISLTKEFPSDSFSWKVLGAIFGETGRKLEALDAFKKATSLDPEDPAGLFSLSIVLQELDRLDESQEITKQVIELKPDLAEAHYNLGFIMQEFGRLDESEASYRKVISLKPNWAEAYFNLGNTLKKLGQYEESESTYKKAIELKPDYPEAFNNLGNIYRLLGKLDVAEENYRLAIHLNPLYSEARINLNKVSLALVPAWHLRMMNDEVRNKAYYEAIKIAVDRGNYVLEIGTGSGILSMMAAESGAEHVTTCESSKTIAKTAKRIISSNGYEKQISVINKNSTELVIGQDLPKKADLIISEILSAGFVGEGVRKTMLDANNRLLKKDGKIIPELGLIRVALVENNKEVSEAVSVSNSQGFDLSEFNSITQDEFSLHLKGQPNFLSDPIDAFSINLYNNEEIMKEEKVLKVKVTKSGDCIGIVQWLKVQIYQDIEYENKPGETFSHWPTPLYRFDQPVSVKAGEIIEIRAFLDEDEVCFYQ